MYSIEHLRALKHHQADTGRIACRWPWEPENIAFLFGGNILFGARPVLSIRGSTVLGAYRGKFTQNDVARVLFNIDLKSRDGKSIARVERNLFETYTADLEDFIFTPSRNRFRIEHASGTKLKLEYHRYNLTRFEQQVSCTLGNSLLSDPAMDLARVFAIDSEGKVPAVSITGKIMTPDATLRIRARDLQMTMYCYHDEKVTLKGELFAPTGVLRISHDDDEVLRFG